MARGGAQLIPRPWVLDLVPALVILLIAAHVLALAGSGWKEPEEQAQLVQSLNSLMQLREELSQAMQISVACLTG